MTELKRCPFCGEEAHHSRAAYGHHNIECNYCTAEAGYSETKELAAKEWNKRAPITDELVEAVQTAYQEQYDRGIDGEEIRFVLEKAREF